MKRLFVCFLTLALLLSLCCSCEKSKAKETCSFPPPVVDFYPKEAEKLIANKKDISDTAKAFIYSEHDAIIPLFAVLEAFDAKITWNSKTMVTIKLNDDEYVLDMLKNEIRQKGDSINAELFNLPLLDVNINHHQYFKQLDNEYYIDTCSALNYLGRNKIYVDIDSGYNRIFVNKSRPEDEQDTAVNGSFSVDDYTDDIQRYAAEMEKTKDTLPAGKLTAYQRNYGDLNSSLSARHAAIVAFSLLYENDFIYWEYTTAELDVYRDDGAECWMVKFKSPEEILLSNHCNKHHQMIVNDYGCMVILRDDGKLLLSADTLPEQ